MGNHIAHVWFSNIPLGGRNWWTPNNIFTLNAATTKLYSTRAEW